MLFSGGFNFFNFLADLLAVFFFVMWFWLLMVVLGDLLRREDLPGWGKVLWVIALIVAPYIGVFVYLILEGRRMAARRADQAERAHDELRRAVGFSVSDEIEKLDRLKKSGTITDTEFARLRAHLVH